MWQPKSFSGINKDSDQSISDEDEEQQDCRWPDNVVSLAGTFDRKKESLGVASQLELLKGVHQRDIDLSSEDEVEVPEFCNQSDINHQCNIEGDTISLKRDDAPRGPDEQLSSAQKGSKALIESAIDWDNVSSTLNFHNRGKEKQMECYTQSAIHKHSTRLDPSIETGRWPTHHLLSLKDKTPSKGGRRKTVLRPSSHVEPCRKGVLSSSVQTDKDPKSDSSDELLDESEPFDLRLKKKTNHFEDSRGEMSKSRLTLPVGAVMQLEDSKCSMVELLDHIQGKNSKPYKKGKTKERVKCHGGIRNLRSSGNNLIDDEDAGESMSSGSSTDNEDIAQKHKPGTVEPGKKTMADKFQEAFGSTPVLDRRPSFMAPKLSSTGIFGRLQQVMQWQKEQDTEFLKKQQTEVWPKDEARCIDVKILSRSFDAKLTVCHCSLLENEESSVQNPQHESFGKTWTVIFNARVCGDVDLEVGRLIRIHPPWKEVQVQHCGEIIILATYFSEI